MDSSAEVQDVALEGLGKHRCSVPEDRDLITVWMLLVEDVQPYLHLWNCACQLPILHPFSQHEHLKLARLCALFLTLEAYGGLDRSRFVELSSLVRADPSIEHMIDTTRVISP